MVEVEVATWKCKQRTDTGYRLNIFFSFFYGRSARSAGASGPTVVRGALTQGAEGEKKKKSLAWLELNPGHWVIILIQTATRY